MVALASHVPRMDAARARPFLRPGWSDRNDRSANYRGTAPAASEASHGTSLNAVGERVPVQVTIEVLLRHANQPAQPATCR